jgi:hypothetical protein
LLPDAKVNTATHNLLLCRPATTFAPLIFVLGVSMIKELVEDIKRYRADREINARLVLVFNTNTKAFEDRPWRAVKVCAVHCLNHTLHTTTCGFLVHRFLTCMGKTNLHELALEKGSIPLLASRSHSCNSGSFTFSWHALVLHWHCKQLQCVAWPTKIACDQVGDILQVQKDTFFPADLLLLSVPESADGLAYVETINLDGESNLKIKKALDQTQQITLDTLSDFTVGLHVTHMSSSLTLLFRAQLQAISSDALQSMPEAYPSFQSLSVALSVALLPFRLLSKNRSWVWP